MTRRLLPPADLGWVVLTAVLALLASMLGLKLAPVRIALELVAILLLPGYALAAAGFAPRSLGFGELLVLTLGLSLVAGCLDLLLLILAGVRITAHAWAPLLFAVTVIAALVAAVRFPQPPRFSLSPLQLGASELGLIAMLVLAVAIATTSVVFAASNAEHKHGSGFTELAAVPRSEAGTEDLDVAIRNLEGRRMTYRLISTPGLESLDGKTITVAAGGTWAATIPLPLEDRVGRVSIRLYRAGQPAPYRSVFTAGFPPLAARP